MRKRFAYGQRSRMSCANNNHTYDSTRTAASRRAAEQVARRARNTHTCLRAHEVECQTDRLPHGRRACAHEHVYKRRSNKL